MNTVVKNTSLSGFLRIRDFIPDLIPVSRATLWRWVREGRFPSPIKISAAVTVWRTADVEDWLVRASREGSSK